MNSSLVQRLLHALGSGFTGGLIGILFGMPRYGFLFGFLVGLVSRPTGLTRAVSRIGTLGGLALLTLFFLPLIGVLSLSLLPVLVLVGLGILSYSLLGGSGNIGGSWSWNPGPSLTGTQARQAVVSLLAEVVRRSPGGRKIQFELVRRFIRRMGPNADPQTLWNQFLESREEPVDVAALCRTIHAATRPAERRYLMQVLVSLALVPDRVPEELRDLLTSIAEAFDIPPRNVQRLLDRGGGRTGTGGSRRYRGRGGNGTGRRTRGPDLNEAYRVLGVDPSASKEEVRQAYQEKVKQHHPDRHRNEDNGEYEEAEEKMAQVNQAYQTIKETWS